MAKYVGGYVVTLSDGTLRGQAIHRGHKKECERAVDNIAGARPMGPDAHHVKEIKFYVVKASEWDSAFNGGEGRLLRVIDGGNGSDPKKAKARCVCSESISMDIGTYSVADVYGCPAHPRSPL